MLRFDQGELDLTISTTASVQNGGLPGGKNRTGMGIELVELASFPERKFSVRHFNLSRLLPPNRGEVASSLFQLPISASRQGSSTFSCCHEIPSRSIFRL
jgi:hypothetical protein